MLVLVIERRVRPRPPGLFAAYIALYCFGRLWIELLRVDPAHELAGLRVNAWVSLLGLVAGVVWYVLSQRRGARAHPCTGAAEGPTMSVPAAAGAPETRSARRTDASTRSARTVSDAASRVRAWPSPSVISSWTSTPSRARSTSC